MTSLCLCASLQVSTAAEREFANLLKKIERQVAKDSGVSQKDLEANPFIKMINEQNARELAAATARLSHANPFAAAVMDGDTVGMHPGGEDEGETLGGNATPTRGLLDDTDEDAAVTRSPTVTNADPVAAREPYHNPFLPAPAGAPAVPAPSQFGPPASASSQFDPPASASSQFGPPASVSSAAGATNGSTHDAVSSTAASVWALSAGGGEALRCAIGSPCGQTPV